MPKRLVYTVTYGSMHEQIGVISHPLIRQYADRHGAEFKVIGQDALLHKGVHPSYEDFRIPQWLDEYDEIVHLDTDLLVANDTPWLLTQSCGMMCAMDESSCPDLRLPHLINYAAKTGNPLPTDNDGRVGYSVRYFNLGVFGVTRKDRSIWIDPECFWDDSMGHQTFINYRLLMRRHPIRDLGPDFNALVYSWTKYPIHQSAYIIHYAGFRDLRWVLERASNDMKALAAQGRV